MTAKNLSVVPPTDPPHTTLTIDDVDELYRLHRSILVRSALIASVLNDEQTPEPVDRYQPIGALTLEALELLAVDVADAGREAAAILTRAGERSKGGVS